MLNNFHLVLGFCPQTSDGDTFIYTEMLDRSKRKGNNGVRLLKTFYHRSQDEFIDQFESIKKICDLSNVRACTRLSPRSYKKVGKVFTKLVVEAALTDNWAGMKSLYNRACGIVTPNYKYWLLDVDIISPDSEALGKKMKDDDLLVETIPSKKGLHYIVRPFNVMKTPIPNGVQLHKDNPTNLYIPEGAE